MIDVSQIVTGLWVGAAPERWSEIDSETSLGTPDVVFCAPHRHEDLATWPSRPNWRHLPFTDDIQPPTARERDVIRQAVQHVVDARRVGRPVLIFCREGRNRSALVAGLAIRQLLPDFSVDDVMTAILAKRPRALSNYFFTQYVLFGLPA